MISIGHIASCLQVKPNQNDLINNNMFPDSLDWRTKGVVTSVQDYSDSPHVAAVVMVGK